MADETKQASFWFPGLRLLPRLPLKTETNYADLESVTSNTKDASVAEYRRPFVIHEEYISGGDPRYAFLERRGKGHDLGEVAEAGERQWAATVRVQDNQPGVIVDVHGAPQHVLASADFTSPDDTDAADFQPEISWKNCRFTVCAEFHEFAQASFPPGDNSVGDAENTLLIRVPHKRCDYLVEGTAVDVDSEGELVLSGGGWIQDDRPQLKQIAKAAYEWYNTPRASVEIEKHNLDCAFPSAPGGALVAFDVGYVVSGIGTGANQKQVNAIINKISFNLRAGILNVSTSFAEFDFARGLS